MWELLELLLRRPELDDVTRAAILEAWDAEQGRRHERWLVTADRRTRYVEALTAFLALVMLVLTGAILAEQGHEWVAVALFGLIVAVTALFLGRSTGSAETGLARAGLMGALRGLFGSGGGAQQPQAVSPLPTADAGAGQLP
ncbi:hypothetical protein ACH4E7_39610 [Kitasatospora sp. NPDC018058]|uniref:hypothetical protein n=1 Tax=Kitasatospora sp. NPDC018058 TaxID=3364025 RepID=UPI0037C10C68